MPESHCQPLRVPFDSALEPSLALKVMDYVHPRDVVQDDRLGPAEKRAILSAWASDACAVESRPGFRWLHGTPGPILVDHVLAALRMLDDRTGHAGAASGRQAGHGRLFIPSANAGATVEGMRR